MEENKGVIQTGVRWEIEIGCVYCGHRNKEVWYAPTCGSDIFTCENCKKVNFITEKLTAKKMEEINVGDVKDGFCNATMGMLTDEEIDRGCGQHFKDITSKH